MSCSLDHINNIYVNANVHEHAHEHLYEFQALLYSLKLVAIHMSAYDPDVIATVYSNPNPNPNLEK